MLPPDLAVAVEKALRGVPLRDLARSVEALSAQYRGEPRAHRRAVRSESEVQAYLAARLPATYAAVAAALDEAADRRPGWRPRTVLDAGAGPGTAMWAATQRWPSIESALLVESDARMVAAGRRLAAESSNPAIRLSRWQTADMAGAETPPCDLVIAAYSLGEPPPDRLAAIVTRLWSACTDTMLIVEPGTPRGFATVRAARDLLRAAGARTLAPCPHQHACPIAGERWCHFAVRLERSRLHRAAKRGDLAYEDEKYSYAAMSRHPGLPVEARVIGHPRAGHGRIDLDLCTPAGLSLETIGRNDRDRYRAAHRARWGSAVGDRDLDPGDALGEG